MLNIPPKWLNGVAIIKHRPEFHRKFVSWTVWERARRPTCHTWLSSTSSVKRNRECFRRFLPWGRVCQKQRRSLIYMRFLIFNVSSRWQISVDDQAVETCEMCGLKRWDLGVIQQWLQASSRARSAICLPSVDDWNITGLFFFWLQIHVWKAVFMFSISSRRFMMKRFTGLIK